MLGWRFSTQGMDIFVMHVPRSTAAALFGALLVTSLGRDALAQEARKDVATKETITTARRNGEAMQRALKTLSPACILGNARDADGAWVGAGHAQGVPSTQTAQEYSLDRPVDTHVVRAAMDRQAWKLLDKVEVRDADGQWLPAWSGAKAAAPARCDYLWFKQALARDVRVGAVRLVFRRENGLFTAGDVAVLKAAR